MNRAHPQRQQQARPAGARRRAAQEALAPSPANGAQALADFELERHNEFWRRLPQSAGLGIHVMGELREGMEMECWALRS